MQDVGVGVVQGHPRIRNPISEGTARGREAGWLHLSRGKLCREVGPYSRPKLLRRLPCLGPMKSLGTDGIFKVSYTLNSAGCPTYGRRHPLDL